MSPISSKLLALSANVKPGWKGLEGTDALAYFAILLVTKIQSFLSVTPETNVIKLFKAAIYKCL